MEPSRLICIVHTYVEITKLLGEVKVDLPSGGEHAAGNGR